MCVWRGFGLPLRRLPLRTTFVMLSLVSSGRLSSLLMTSSQRACRDARTVSLLLLSTVGAGAVELALHANRGLPATPVTSWSELPGCLLLVLDAGMLGCSPSQFPPARVMGGGRECLQGQEGGHR